MPKNDSSRHNSLSCGNSLVTLMGSSQIMVLGEQHDNLSGQQLLIADLIAFKKSGLTHLFIEASLESERPVNDLLEVDDIPSSENDWSFELAYLSQAVGIKVVYVDDPALKFGGPDSDPLNIDQRNKHMANEIAKHMHDDRSRGVLLTGARHNRRAVGITPMSQLLIERGVSTTSVDITGFRNHIERDEIFHDIDEEIIAVTTSTRGVPRSWKPLPGHDAKVYLRHGVTPMVGARHDVESEVDLHLLATVQYEALPTPETARLLATHKQHKYGTVAAADFLESAAVEFQDGNLFLDAARYRVYQSEPTDWEPARVAQAIRHDIDEALRLKALGGEAIAACYTWLLGDEAASQKMFELAKTDSVGRYEESLKTTNDLSHRHRVEDVGL